MTHDGSIAVLAQTTTNGIAWWVWVVLALIVLAAVLALLGRRSPQANIATRSTGDDATAARWTTGGLVAALFPRLDGAELAFEDLRSAGFPHIEISDAAGASGGAQRAAAAFTSALVERGFEKRDARELVDRLARGGALVSVEAGTDVDHATAIFARYGGDVRRATGVAPPAPAAPAPAPAASVAEARRLQLRAEQLEVNKDRVQYGEAIVHKETVTEMKTVQVPVTHEDLVIEQRTEDPSGTAVHEETTRIPLSEEQISVSKERIAREEVTFGKRPVDDVEHVDETVRREELRIDDPTRSPGSP